MDIDKFIKEKYKKGLDYEFTNEEKAGYLAAIEDVKQALSLGAVVGQSEQLKNAEQEGYKKGWEEGAQYGYSAAHEGR